MIEFEYPTLWTDSFKLNSMASEENVDIAEINVQKGTADELIEATLTALETGVLTPLVKEELKYTIQSRRLAKGQGELGVEFKLPEQSEVSIYIAEYQFGQKPPPSVFLYFFLNLLKQVM